MLRKKFYTQRFNSSGSINNVTVTPSTNYRLNRLKRCFSSVEVASKNFTQYANRNSSSRTERIKRCVFENSTPPTNERVQSCINRVPNAPMSIRHRKTCFITKDIGFKSSSEYIKIKKSNCNNDIPDDLGRPCGFR